MKVGDKVCSTFEKETIGTIVKIDDLYVEVVFGTNNPVWCMEKFLYIFNEPQKSKREEILDTAKEYVTKDRNATHGEPEDSFGIIAKLWSAYTEKEFTSVDVCVMLALLKVARIKNMPTNEDNWVDLAGYSACGGEVASMLPNFEIKP